MGYIKTGSNRDLPLYVISFNRLEPLQALLNRIETVSHISEIIIVDNNSTYEPLLDFYETCPHAVIKLKENLGHQAPWIANLVLSDVYYAVTDPDIVLDDECPNDVIHFLWEAKHFFQRYVKIGVGLHIDDLPDCYNQKQNVIKWEKQFWDYATRHPKVDVTFHPASIDTTLAVYEPNSKHALAPSIRTDKPYLAKHLPWYSNSENPTEEEIYYKAHTVGKNATWVYDDLMDPALKAAIQNDFTSFTHKK